jgi:hypothetical protein
MTDPVYYYVYLYAVAQNDNTAHEQNDGTKKQPMLGSHDRQKEKTE